MIVDEMELVRRLRDVDPLPREISEKTEVVLRATMAVSKAEAEESTQVEPRRLLARRASDGSHTPWHGLRARRALAGVAAAAVVVGGAGGYLASTSSSTRSHAPAVATRPGQSTKVPATSNHVGSSLVRLADYVSGLATPTGDATLVARTTGLGGGKSVTVYDLYTDDGQYFFSQTESGLPGQVSTDHNLADGLFAREIAAAKLAATGNVQTAGEDMAAAPDPSKYIPQTTQATVSGADAAKQPGTYHPGEVIGTDYDNYVWEDSQDALIAGSGDPQVRAGVLRILATLPDVTVTSGTSGGQSTLVLTAGTDEMGAGSTEQLTINATTGVPLSFASGTAGQTPSGTVTYQVSRVTTSDIAAGKF